MPYPFVTPQEPFTEPGNALRPNRPLSMPSARPGGGTSYGGADDNAVSSVVDPTRFPQFQTITYALVAGQQLELLAEPPTIRLFLMIRVTNGSTGNLGVGFNVQPQNINGANIELIPGGYAFFDQTVPQNRIFGVASDVCNVVVTYANR